MPTSLVIHGHFYQPPRENPWTEVVEPEPSAAPFHDWNERIYQECYRSNGNARIVSSQGVVESITNNYLYLNYNFGPTLLSWMEKRHPQGYRRILEADRESVGLRGGHGNAIAQAYNHCILPLCNERDRRTQVGWGLTEFRHRFGREPESLWLPETACNDETLGTLIDEKLRYVILAPGQCLRVRKLGSHEWVFTENGDVDPGKAYRYFHRDGSGRSIALFFYDGPIARAIAFGEGLVSSQDLLGVMGRAERGNGRLISVATDGESYGHHTKWGDRTLAYALTQEAEKQDYHITNYAQYLDQFPPQWEAEIKLGPEEEGTAWSCAHGVGRWIRDCGCSTGGEAHWNQAWRGPLREALNQLRDHAALCFAKGAAGLLKDPWAARDEFIKVVLDPSEETRRRFLEAQWLRPLSGAEGVRALALLDMQRRAMLMFTSCGWFFTDISGIETIQILKYACRLMDDLAELGFESPRQNFLEILARAKSNLPEMGSGADIFLKLVEPTRVGMDRLAAHLAIGSLAEDLGEGELGAYTFRFDGLRYESLGKMRLATGRLSLQSRLTGRVDNTMFAAAHFGGIDFNCCVTGFEEEAAFEAAALKVAAEFRQGLIPPLLKLMRQEFGPGEFGLEDLLPGHRDRIARAVFGDIVQNLSNEYSRVFEENHRYLQMFQAAGFTLPTELRTAAEYTLSRQFEEAIRAQRSSRAPEAYAKARDIAAEAERLGYRLELGVASQLFGELITEDVRIAMANPDSSNFKRAISLIELTRKLGIRLNLDRAQEFAVRAADQGQALHAPEDLRRLAELLYLAPELLVKSAV
jgi:alpha-amylase/alpha-mannosidase (GH57 family)